MIHPGARAGAMVAGVLGILFAATPIPTVALPPAPQCSLVGKWPSSLHATAIDAGSTLRFDLLGPHEELLGSQIVFDSAETVTTPLLSAEALSPGQQPRVRCSVDNSATLTALTVIDLGPKITLHSLYVGKGAVTASFYAFQEDFFAGRNDEGLVDQLFSVQLDNRRPYELQVTAKPGADVAVRFDGVGVGPHRLVIGEMDRGGGSSNYYVGPLCVLKFVQPAALAAAK